MGEKVSMEGCRQVRSNLDSYFYQRRERDPEVKTSEYTIHVEWNLFEHLNRGKFNRRQYPKSRCWGRYPLRF